MLLSVCMLLAATATPNSTQTGGYAPVPNQYVLIEFLETTDHQAPSIRGVPRSMPGDIKLKPAVDVSRVQMILNGSEITFITQPTDASSPIREQRWSNAGGTFRDFTFMRDGGGTGPNAHFAIRDHAEAMRNVMNGYVRNRLFALGLDFEKLIHHVESEELINGQRLVTGKMRFAKLANCSFSLSVSQEGLVRKALLEWNNPNDRLQFVVETKGTVESSGFSLAKHGTFKELNHIKGKDGGETTHTARSFSLDVIRIETISPDRYLELTSFGLVPGTFLEDRTADSYSYIDPHGNVNHISTLAAIKDRFNPSSTQSGWVWRILIIHAILFSAGAGWYLWRRQKIQSAKLETP